MFKDRSRMATRWAGLAAFAAAATLALTACGGSSSSSSSSTGSASAATSGSGSGASSATSGKPFEAVAIVDLSGPAKVYGPVNALGVKAGATYVNTHGGILGRPVHVTVLNDNGDPATAASVLQQYLSSHPKPDYVFPGTESDETTALLPLLARLKILAIDSEDGNGQLGADASTKFPEQYAVQTSTLVSDTSAAQWFKQHGIKKVAIAQEGISYTTSETPTMLKALDAAGIAHTVATFPATSLDLTPEISALKSSGATGLYFEGVGPAVGYGLAARAKLGWNVPVVGDLAASALDITKLVTSQSQLNGVKLLVFREDAPSGATLPAVVAISHLGLPAGALVSVACPGWDSMLLVKNAAAQAHSTDGAGIAAALQNLSPAAQTDPNYCQYHTIGFTASSHNVTTGAPSDYPIITPGPVKNGVF